MKNDTKIDDEMTLRIRQAKDADMPSILTIEQDSFVEPWCQNDFDSHQDSLGMVAEYNDQVVGFIVYENHPGILLLLNIAVAKAHRRRGVGTQLIDKLIAKLRPNSQRSIVVIVRETNNAAIEFFGKLGFRAAKVLRDHYDDSPEDAYRLEWNLAGHREIANSEA